MRSHLLEGVVRHRRARPFVYALEHGVHYLALDLDELDDVERSSRLIGRNRRGVLELRDGDHLDPPAGGPAGGVPRPPSGGRRGPGRLADHARDQPARARLRVQPGQLLPLP